VITPINLGWHGKRADSTAGYTIFVPTGRYTDGANDNTGLGMWGHELSVGTTVYLSESRQWHAATLATFDFQSKKEDSETKVGNVMNPRGRPRRRLPEGRADRRPRLLHVVQVDRRSHRGLSRHPYPGQEQSVCARAGSAAGAGKKQHALWRPEVNYQWEVYARTTTQGSALTILATFLMKPLKLSNP
jgi:hypothetical protein